MEKDRTSFAGKSTFLSSAWRPYHRPLLFGLLFLLGCQGHHSMMGVKEANVAQSLSPAIQESHISFKDYHGASISDVPKAGSKKDEKPFKVVQANLITNPKAKFGSEWTERVRYGGDVRLRSDHDRMIEEPVQTRISGDLKKVEYVTTALVIQPSSPKPRGEETFHSAPTRVAQRDTGLTPEQIEQERIEKITAKVLEKIMANIQEQVRKQVQEELAKGLRELKQERIEAITASVVEEIKKSYSDPIKTKERPEPSKPVAELEKKKDIEKKPDPVIQEQVKTQVKEEVSRAVKTGEVAASVWDWISQHVQLDGDVRLRYQGDLYDPKNADLLKPSNPSELLNTKEDRHRFLLRARAGIIVKLSDQVEGGLRIATGTTSNPVSQNVTLGDFEGFKNIVLDRAYLRWKLFPEVSIWAGRIPNPFFSTDLVWDSDLRFDGLGLNVTFPFGDRFALFANALVSPVEEFELTTSDKWLFGGQVGAQHKPWADIRYRIAAAYYDYRNITGKANDPLRPGRYDYTAPKFQQKGNTLFDIDPTSALKFALASEYRLINVTGDLDIGLWKPTYLTLMGDYVRNLAFDRNKVALRTGNPRVKKEVYGYQVGMSVGPKRIKKFGDWELFGYYKYLGADAVLDAFTDSDFHGGGTNAKGWILGGSLGLYKNTWVTLRWISTDQISGPPFALDTLQVDVNLRF